MAGRAGSYQKHTTTGSRTLYSSCIKGTNEVHADTDSDNAAAQTRKHDVDNYRQRLRKTSLGDTLKCRRHTSV